MDFDRPSASKTRWSGFYWFVVFLCAFSAAICFMAYADARETSDVFPRSGIGLAGTEGEALPTAGLVVLFQGGVAFTIMGLMFAFVAIVVDRLAYIEWAAAEQVNLQQQLIESIEDLKEGAAASERLCELIEARQNPATPTASATPQQSESRQVSQS